MKKYNSEVWVTIFHNAWDLISQVNGDRVSFAAGDMYVWRDGTICASYDLNRFKSWRIIDKFLTLNVAFGWSNISLISNDIHRPELSTTG